MGDVARHNIKSRPHNNLLISKASSRGVVAFLLHQAKLNSSGLAQIWVLETQQQHVQVVLLQRTFPGLIETSKYVESQANAVGANVKKLCTELIQDLITTPMLSPEGGEKKFECALHCKCHCLDSEKSKLIGTDATGIENGGDTVDNTVQKEDIMKDEGSQVETPNIVNKGLNKVEKINVDTTREPQDPKNVEVCGPELKNMHGKNDTNNEQKLATSIRQSKPEDVEGRQNIQEELNIAKVEFEGNCWTSDRTGESKLKSEGFVGEVPEAAVYRNEAVFAEEASRPKAKDNKDLVGANESNATYINCCTGTFLGSQEDKLQPQMCGFLQERRERNAEGLCKRPVSAIHFQSVSEDRELHLDTYACYAKSFSSAEDLQAEEMKAVRVGGSFQSMCTYNFKDEEPIIMSEFFSKEEVYDEEQSAHWFVGEDIRKAFQPDIFSTNESQYGEGFANEFDLDWELL
ncbi:hypothetical protein L7F22_025381 [Adiantum nelumboides]|nr:hypothetical protein [Adiantum nelumboides]